MPERKWRIVHSLKAEPDPTEFMWKAQPAPRQAGSSKLLLYTCGRRGALVEITIEPSHHKKLGYFVQEMRLVFGEISRTGGLVGLQEQV